MNMRLSATPAAVAALGLLGGLLVLTATGVHGPGLSPDSVSYISAARNLCAGRGLTNYLGVPLTLWPPLYPAVLAAVSAAGGIDARPAAAGVNAVLFGLLIFSTGVMLRRLLPRRPALAMLGAALAAFVGPLFYVSSWALSEILFCLLVVLFMHQVAMLRARCGRRAVAVLAVLAAAAFLTRYIGLALLGAGGLALLLCSRGSLGRRLTDAAAFGLLASAPAAAWLARNYAVADTFFGQRGSAHMTLGAGVRAMLERIAGWFVPDRIWCAAWLPGVAAVAAALVIAWWWCTRGERGRWHAFAPALLTGSAYAGLLLYAETSGGIDMIDDRLLAPLLVPLLTILLLLAEPAWGRVADRLPRRLRLPAAVAGACLVFAGPARAVLGQARVMRGEGAGGYTTSAWRRSETVRYVAGHRLADERPIYSNRPDALYILADIPARMSVPLHLLRTAAVPALYPKFDESFVVWFDDHPRRPLAHPDRLSSVATLQPAARLEDGAVYRLTPRRSPP